MSDARLLNKEWRVEHLYKIIDINQHKVVFKKNRPQRHFEENKHTRNIVLKSRQLGFTTYEAIDLLDDTLFSKNFAGLFIAHTQNDAVEIFDKKIDYAWKNFDSRLSSLWKEDANTSNKLKFDFGEGNSSFISVSNSGRSGTNNRVHVSEFAKLCIKYPIKADEIITGTIPSVPPDGRLDIESTAEGMGGHFYEMFWEAWNRKRPPMPTEFRAHFYNWRWDDKELDKIEREMVVEEMDEAEKFREYQKLHNLTNREITYYYTKWLSLNRSWTQLHQEYPTTPEEAFISSGTPYFNNEKIVKLIAKATEPICTGTLELYQGQPSFVRGEGDLKIWEMPVANESYVIGGDTAEGLMTGDWQILDVINNRTLKTVAKFKSHCTPDELAKVAVALGRWYNTAYMAIEANKDGLWVNTECFKLGYENLYYREQVDDITHTVAKKLGFKTDMSSRPVILAELQKLVNSLEDCWNDAGFLRECLTFIRNQIGRPEAMQGAHDDEVMAKAIAMAVRHNAPIAYTTTPTIPKNNLEITKARLTRLYGKKQNNISQRDYE